MSHRSRPRQSQIRARAIVVFASLMLALGCSSPPPARPPSGIPKGDYSYFKTRTSFEIKAALKEQNAASFAIAVVDNGEIVFEGAFGFADKERATEAESTTVYRVGSISKVFTTIALMQLVDEGKVDLDAPVSQYLPEFSLLPPPPTLVVDDDWSPADITVRSLLTHHSGIPSDLFHRMIGKSPHALSDYARLLNDEYAISPTHHAHAYSNVAMTLVGHIVETVRKRPFVDVMKQHVLEPSGMKLSSFDLTPQIRASIAQGHQAGEVKEMFPIGEKPAGSLYASAHEMALFMRTVLNDAAANADANAANTTASSSERAPNLKAQKSSRSLLPKTRFDEMWTAQDAGVVLDLDFKMGLTWFVSNEDVPGSGRTVGHDGATIYHRSAMAMLPDHGLGVVVLTNSAEGRTGKLCKDALLLALETKTGLRRAPKLPVAPETNPFTPAELDAFTGDYDSQFGFIHIVREKEELATTVFGQKLLFVPTSDRTFNVKASIFGLFSFTPESLENFHLRFDTVDDRDLIVNMDHGKRALGGSRVEVTPIHAAWTARIGRYRIENLDGDYPLFDEFEIKEDTSATKTFLVFTVKPNGQDIRLPYALDARDEKRAIIQGIGRGRGESVVVVDDAASTIRHSGYILKRDTSAK